jgi:hypothetical protein
MKRILAFSLLLGLVLSALIACGGEGLSLFPRSQASDLTVVGPVDGTVFTGSQPLALQIGSADPAGHPSLDVRVRLVSSSGEDVWDKRFASPALNEDLGLQLPDLPEGRYRLEVTVTQDGEQVQQQVATIFSVRERPRITGITSFPPLITPSSRVLLSAEIVARAGSDPWLRWTWRGKTIAQGSASAGTAAVLWTAPADAGVFTVTLEVFPVAPPTGTGYSFRSPIAMSTDIYVSASGAATRDELGPPASYLSLLHLQGDLVDSAAAARGQDRAAVAVGSPSIVPAGDGFGYRLQDGSGFRLPWPVLPVDDGNLAPFTLSVGLRPEPSTESRRILTATAGTLSFALGLGDDASPELGISIDAAPPLAVRSGAPALEAGHRYLVSLSVVPGADGLSVQWFLDGRQVSETAARVVLPRLGTEGSADVGGESGLAAVIDELGVYYRDEAGRPATDPTLFREAMRKRYGDRLLLADGFDGLHLAGGFDASGNAGLRSGTLTLPPEAAITLPPIRYPADGLSVELRLEAGSLPSANVQVAWSGAAASPPFLDDRLVAESGTIRLTLQGENATGLTADGQRNWHVPGPPAEMSAIVIRIACPSQARSPVAITSVLALGTVENE